MVFLVDLLYNVIFLPLAIASTFVAQLFVAKVKTRAKGVMESMKLIGALPAGERRIWIHSASMGEFEQVIPVIAELKQRYPSYKFVGTFYSPSGFRAGEKSTVLDYTFYLPTDSVWNSRKIAQKIDAKLLIFARYDVWRNLVLSCQTSDTAVAVLNATFPSSGRWWASRMWTRDTYKRCDLVVSVTMQDQILFESLLNQHVQYLPDTRADRIKTKLLEVTGSHRLLIPSTLPTVVLGSVWKTDIDLVRSSIQTLSNLVRFVIVPHEPSEAFVVELEQEFGAVRLSAVNHASASVIVVDSVGQLLELYQYADAVYVGGGHGSGVHSLLEPAGKGVPISCGPNIQRSREALGLRSNGALTIIQSPHDVSRWLHDTVLNNSARERIGNLTHEYFSNISGSSKAAADLLSGLVERNS